MRSFILPLALLAGAWLASPLASRIPASFEGLWAYGPHVSLGIVALLGLGWRRGRAVLAACLLLAGLLAYERLLPEPYAAEPVVLLVLLALVPINIGGGRCHRERGVVTMYGAIRLGIIATSFLIMGALQRLWPVTLEDIVYWGETIAIAAGEASVPLIAIAGLGLVLCAVAAWFRRDAFTPALTVAMLGFLIAIGLPEREHFLYASVIAGGVMLIVAMLADSWSLAYRDDLTGLPGRRALGEAFLSLGNRYVVAMMDVDHFKKFNDTHGHDVGDDVLRMVASQIAKVAGGGKAYRYGGEEFTVVFPSRSQAEAVIALEGVRAAIEDYEVVVRDQRTDDDKAAERGRGARAGQKTVAVTISIGVAERDRGEQAEEVLKRADEALYAAKKAGRNRLRQWGQTKSRENTGKAA
ncbi:MAG: GGDEF domain-containing protein [Gammaproteobacteria bacterium]|nr:GGDEF domain-containing protein [Gammaproteobacteria bacterium]